MAVRFADDVKGLPAVLDGVVAELHTSSPMALGLASSTARAPGAWHRRAAAHTPRASHGRIQARPRRTGPGWRLGPPPEGMRVYEPRPEVETDRLLAAGASGRGEGSRYRPRHGHHACPGCLRLTSREGRCLDCGGGTTTQRGYGAAWSRPWARQGAGGWTKTGIVPVTKPHEHE